MKLLMIGFGIFIMSIVMHGFFWPIAQKLSLIDKPNQRSSHTVNTPRGAGIIFSMLWMIITIGLCKYGALSQKVLSQLIPGTFLMTLLGFRDDFKPLSTRFRFFVQILTAFGFCLSISSPFDFNLGFHHLSFGLLSLPLAVVGMVWSTNLYNFMDGLDGIAASEAVFIFGTASIIFCYNQQWSLGIVLAVLPILILGFLVWNWPQAKMFMGDSGSYFLGFLVGVFIILGYINFKLPLSVWMILYGAFWFDATITLIRRMINKQDWHSPHRLHAFQRINQLGWSHQKVLLSMIVLNGILSSLTLWGYFFEHLYIALATAISLLSLIYLWIERKMPFKQCLE
ncbi:MAG: glycosyl transferase family 4 [Francisellaceae bacterium]|nr:glycosyl transferase family 4 [Francisellaceae bacterium]